MVVNNCIERHNNFAHAIRLYPNPTKGRFRIQFLTDLYTAFTMDIIDADGHIVYLKKYPNMVYGAVVPVDLTGLPSGMYMVRIYNDQDHASFKLDIEH